MALIDKPGMDIPQWDPSQHHSLVWWQHGWFWPDLRASGVARAEDIYEPGTKSRGTLIVSGMVHIHPGSHGPD